MRATPRAPPRGGRVGGGGDGPRPEVGAPDRLPHAGAVGGARRRRRGVERDAAIETKAGDGTRATKRLSENTPPPPPPPARAHGAATKCIADHAHWPGGSPPPPPRRAGRRAAPARPPAPSRASGATALAAVLTWKRPRPRARGATSCTKSSNASPAASTAARTRRSRRRRRRAPRYRRRRARGGGRATSVLAARRRGRRARAGAAATGGRGRGRMRSVESAQCRAWSTPRAPPGGPCRASSAAARRGTRTVRRPPRRRAAAAAAPAAAARRRGRRAAAAAARLAAARGSRAPTPRTRPGARARPCAGALRNATCRRGTSRRAPRRARVQLGVVPRVVRLHREALARRVVDPHATSARSAPPRNATGSASRARGERAARLGELRRAQLAAAPELQHRALVRRAERRWLDEVHHPEQRQRALRQFEGQKPSVLVSVLWRIGTLWRIRSAMSPMGVVLVLGVVAQASHGQARALLARLSTARVRGAAGVAVVAAPPRKLLRRRAPPRRATRRDELYSRPRRARGRGGGPRGGGAGGRARDARARAAGRRTTRPTARRARRRGAGRRDPVRARRRRAAVTRARAHHDRDRAQGAARPAERAVEDRHPRHAPLQLAPADHRAARLRVVLTGNEVLTAARSARTRPRPAARARGQPDLLTVVRPRRREAVDDSQELLRQVENVVENLQNDELLLDAAAQAPDRCAGQPLISPAGLRRVGHRPRGRARGACATVAAAATSTRPPTGPPPLLLSPSPTPSRRPSRPRGARQRRAARAARARVAAAGPA